MDSKNKLSDFSMHIDNMSVQEFDSMRIILLTLAREMKNLAALDVNDLSLQTLINQISKKEL